LISEGVEPFLRRHNLPAGRLARNQRLIYTFSLP